MGNVDRGQVITFQALLFLLGLVLISSSSIMPTYSYFGPRQQVPSSHSFVLSEASPTFVYNVSYPDFGISSLLTNQSPVHIVVWYQDQVIFNVTDVQEITDFDIEFPVSSPYAYRLEVVRQDADASVDLTTFNWAIAAAYVRNPILQSLTTTVGTIITLYALYLLFKSYRGITSDKARVVRFPAIVLLLLIGTLLCQPLAKGVLAGDFDPVSTVMPLPDETYGFTLNETYPSSSLDLSALYPQGESSVSIKVYSLTSSEYPFQVSISSSTIYSFILEEESDETGWWITIPIADNSSSVVSLERIATDVDGQFSVEVQYRTLASKEDITVPALYGVFGLFAIILGLFLAYRLDT